MWLPPLGGYGTVIAHTVIFGIIYIMYLLLTVLSPASIRELYAKLTGKGEKDA